MTHSRSLQHPLRHEKAAKPRRRREPSVPGHARSPRHAREKKVRRAAELASLAFPAPAMATRIFVRGLPPRTSEAEFRKHFAAQGTVTDIRLIPHRRIGYVGYRSAEDAERAVKYFNKTFIATSRIGVELARPVADESLKKNKHARATGPATRESGASSEVRGDASPGSSRKRKRDAFEEQKSDALRNDQKFKEFVEVMQPRSKTKSWANEDSAVLAQQPAAVSDALPQDDQSDDEYEVLPGPESKGVQNESSGLPPAEDTLAVENDAMDLDNDQEERAPVSDADWLRSRTSRVLDFADDVDSHLVTATRRNTGAQQSSAPRSQAEDESAEPMQEDTKEKDEEEDTERGEPTGAKSDIDAAIEKISATSRLFVRNLAYSTEEADLRELFSQFGDIEEVHIAVDTKSQTSKGFAHILFKDPADAVEAFKNLDGTVYQGRLLHIIPAQKKRENTLDEFALSKLPLKKQRELRRKATAATSQFNWNSMYMNADAVVSSVASRLGVSKAELLDPTSSDAGVRQALAETHVINETKAYLAQNGLDLGAFQKREKDDKILLMKNFPFGTTAEELRALVSEYGELARLLLPPAGTIAVVEFRSAPAARAAFAALAYRRFKESILFLEKGPVGLFASSGSSSAPPPPAVAKAARVGASDVKDDDNNDDDAAAAADTHTLFIRNLNFATTSEQLTQAFKPISGFQWALVKMKPDPKNPGKQLSMGFGFAGFKTSAQAHAARAAMDGHVLDGYALLVKASRKDVDAAGERKFAENKSAAAGKRTKVIIKNLPFEATKKDVRALFGQYGTLKNVRVPKKFGGHTRGFAFAEFATAREAANALRALADTHLLGRRLACEFAAQDAQDAEDEIRRMSAKVARQAGTVAVARLKRESKRRVVLDEAGAVDEGV